MRIGFAGTPEFARTALQALLDDGQSVPLVLTQPDRPAGRGMKLQASSVKQLAVQQGIDVAQPTSLRLDGRFAEEAESARQQLEQAQLDVLIVAAYGLLLPRWVLELPRYGCLNIHASLLPRWRGAAPIHRAIEAGDSSTGITIMQMDEGLDTGDMLLTQSLDIAPHDTTASLHDRLATLGGYLIVDAVHQLPHATLQRVPQPADGISYAHKIGKAESLLDWHEPADVLERRIRAFNPFPVAQASLHGQMLKIWAAHPVALPSDTEHTAQPGQIVQVQNNGIDVACGGQTALRLTTLQRPGGKRLDVAQWLHGFAVQAGECFHTPQA